MDTYLQLNKKGQIWVLLSRRPPVYQTLGGQNQEPNSMLCLIHCSFQYIDNEMLILLYLYISTKLSSVHMWSMPYGSSGWSPFKLCDIKLIEGVQRKATRLSRDLRNEPYNIRLTTLGLPTLQFRRDRADMLQVFKILNGYEDIDSSRFFTLSSTGMFLFQYSAGPF